MFINDVLTFDHIIRKRISEKNPTLGGLLTNFLLLWEGGIGSSS